MDYTFSMLLEKRHKPIPKEVQVVENWGWLQIVNHSDDNRIITGDHVLLRAPYAALKKWIKDDMIWAGVGSPILQKFELKGL